MPRRLLFASLLMVAASVLHPEFAVSFEKKLEVRPPRKLQPGEILAVDSEITERDIKYQGGNHAKMFPLKFVEGKTYQIDMSGISLGFLHLVDAKRKNLASDRSSAGSDRPRITHTAKATETCWVICTSWHARPETGRFSLVVKEIDPKELAKPIEIKLNKGQFSLDTELYPPGPRYKDGPCRILTLAMEAGKTYEVEMRSKEFLAHLVVENPEGKMLGESKVKVGEKQNFARVAVTAEKAGTYRIIATQDGWRMGGPQCNVSVKEVTLKK